MGLERKYERRERANWLALACTFRICPICSLRALLHMSPTRGAKTLPLEALTVGVGAQSAKPRTALGAAHAGSRPVLHNNNVISAANETCLG